MGGFTACGGFGGKGLIVSITVKIFVRKYLKFFIEEKIISLLSRSDSVKKRYPMSYITTHKPFNPISLSQPSNTSDQYNVLAGEHMFWGGIYLP